MSDAAIAREVNLGGLPDYRLQPDTMPPPYVEFVLRPTEKRSATGAVSFEDEPWVLVTAQGGRDQLERKAKDWIESIRLQAMQDRVPKHWPVQYAKALEMFLAGEEIPLQGTAIKSWPPLTPAQRKGLIAAGVLTVEHLATANDETKGRIGMGAIMLVQMAQKWIEESKGPGALAAQVEHLTPRLEESERALELARQDIAQLERLIPADQRPAKPATSAAMLAAANGAGKVSVS